jgi:hypothetical protein
MTTATKKPRTPTQRARKGRAGRESASLEFFVYEDNGGAYHWAIAGSGESLARSGSFASYAEAERAGRYVRDGAESARFASRGAGNGAAALGGRDDDASAREESDVGRWLDEGGHFRGQEAGS